MWAKICQTWLNQFLARYSYQLFFYQKDLLSQIDFIIYYTNLVSKANIIYWSFIKYKQVIQIFLDAKLYKMVHSFDIKSVIKAILRKVLQAKILLVFYTDSKSLYNCLIKLSTIHEKRLMIDIINLCQSYERREITKIKWIYEYNKPADLMTKNKSSLAFKILKNTNWVNWDTTKWIE